MITSALTNSKKLRAFSVWNNIWSLKTSVFNLLDSMVDDDSSVITLFYGEDIEKDTAVQLKKEIEEKFSDCDVYMHFGGQPVYYYFISVE